MVSNIEIAQSLGAALKAHILATQNFQDIDVWTHFVCVRDATGTFGISVRDNIGGEGMWPWVPPLMTNAIQGFFTQNPDVYFDPNVAVCPNAFDLREFGFANPIGGGGGPTWRKRSVDLASKMKRQ